MLQFQWDVHTPQLLFSWEAKFSSNWNETVFLRTQSCTWIACES